MPQKLERMGMVDELDHSVHRIGELLSAPHALPHPTKFTPNEGAHLDHIAVFDFAAHKRPRCRQVSV
jgi:hypothetical protein